MATTEGNVTFLTSAEWNAIVEANGQIPYHRYIFGEGPGDYTEYQWLPNEATADVSDFTFTPIGPYSATADAQGTSEAGSVGDNIASNVNISAGANGNTFGAYTAADTGPRTMADFIRDIESQTRASRGYVYDRAADVNAFSRFMNPLARSVIQNQFNPLSAQYMLAAAPTQLGGAPGQVGSFQDFISGGTPLAYGAGAYGARTPEEMSAGPFGTYRSPFTRGQWENRLSQLNLPASGDLSSLGADAQDYLAALSQDEARNMIRQASLAGLNPITQRSLQPGLNRAFSAWEQANPTAGAGQILSDYVRGGMQRRPFAGYV